MLVCLLFTFVFLMLLAAHFFFAWRGWRQLKGLALHDIDMNYVRQEDYFGRSFRNQLQTWLSIPGETVGLCRRIQTPNDTLEVYSGAAHFPRLTDSDAVIVAERIAADEQAVFHRELYARNECVIGASSRLQAVACDGRLHIGPSCQVVRWADAAGDVELGEGSQVGARLTSRGQVLLRVGARAKTVYAPSVITVNGHQPPQPPLLRPVELNSHTITHSQTLARIGLLTHKFTQLVDDTWIYHADFKPKSPLTIQVNLIIYGDAHLPAGSIVQKNCKVRGQLHAELVRFEGSLFVEGDAHLGDGVQLGPITSGNGRIQLGRDISSAHPGRDSVIFARQELLVGRGLRWRGKLSSLGWVRVMGLLLALLPLPIYAEAPNARLDVGAYGGRYSAIFGNTSGGQLQLWVTRSRRFIPALLVDRQTRATGTQDNYAFFSIWNLTPRLYTTQGVSWAGKERPESTFFPRQRYDLRLHFKLPPTQRVVLALGATHLNYGFDLRGQILSPGLLWYSGRWVVEATLFINRLNPGSRWSSAGLFALQYGREGRSWLGFTASGGREIHLTRGITPFEQQFDSLTGSGFYRKWLTRQWGIHAFVEYQRRIGAFSRPLGGLRIFYEF